MTNIKAIVANVHVDDLEKAIPLYEALSDGGSAVQFGYEDLKLAMVGSFLLIEGDMTGRPRQAATILVESLEPVLSAIEHAGAEILEGPAEVPNGMRVQVRHPDGAVFEYLQTA